MIFGILMLVTALSLSSIAAYYSVLGLLAIFAAAGSSIVALGSILEVGKVVATVWLHQNWHRAGWAFRVSLGFFVAGLMFLTSMGIFGLLSKGHIDQGIVSGDVAAQLSVIDEKIRTQRENIESARRALAQMDASVDQVLARSNNEDGARRSAQLRRNQRAERAQLQNDIQQSQREILKLNDERAPIAASVRRVEAEVGPIKYIAALIYGDNPGLDVLERSVRWVIILIVAVFDPLALTLILAANKQFEWSREERKKRESLVEVPPAPVTVDTKPETEAQPQAASPAEESANVAEPLAEPLAEPVVEPLVEPVAEPDIAPIVEQPAEPEVPEETPAPDVQETVDADALTAEAQPDPETERLRRELEEKEKRLQEHIQHLKDLEKKVETLIVESSARPAESKTATKVTVEDIVPAAPVIRFGNSFPAFAAKGDMYLRSDFVPTKLYKFSGRKWLEIDKNTTDAYCYNEQYIKYLINRLQISEYSVNDLTESERTRINEYLSTERER